MQKTKLGVSVGLLGAAVYFCGVLSLLAMIVIAGYILIAEDNIWLRKSAVKAVVIYVAFAVIDTIFSFGSEIFGFLNVIIGWTDSSFYFRYPWHLDSLIQNALDAIEILLFLVLGFKALSQRTIKVGPADNCVNKHM